MLYLVARNVTDGDDNVVRVVCRRAAEFAANRILYQYLILLYREEKDSPASENCWRFCTMVATTFRLEKHMIAVYDLRFSRAMPKRASSETQASTRGLVRCRRLPIRNIRSKLRSV